MLRYPFKAKVSTVNNTVNFLKCILILYISIFPVMNSILEY